jgi:hypothetical protein
LKGDPVIAFSTTGGVLQIDITSPTGIGSAAIEKTSGQWPAKVVMRLHVNGLENFNSYADIRIAVSVSVKSTNNTSANQATRQDGQARRSVLIAMTPGEVFRLAAPVVKSARRIHDRVD